MKWILFSGPSLTLLLFPLPPHPAPLRAVRSPTAARSHRCRAQLINSLQQKAALTAAGGQRRPVGWEHKVSQQEGAGAIQASG